MKIISIKCVAHSRDQVDHIMDSLNEAGFSDDDISVSFPIHNQDLDEELDQEQKLKFPHGMGFGAVMGGIVGAIFGGLAGFGVITIPGADPFVVGGPMLTLCGGAIVGATLAGILGGLIELGLPDTNHENKFVLFINALSHEEAAEIRGILREEGADHIQVHGDISVVAREAHSHPQPQYAGH